MILRTSLDRSVNARADSAAAAFSLASAALLVKVVSARYRLSKQTEEDLAGSLAGVIRGVGGLLMPEAFSDE